MSPNVTKYAKAIVAVLGSVAVIVQAAISDDTITGNEWVKIAFALVTAAGVYLVPATGYVRPATDSVYGNADAEDAARDERLVYGRHAADPDYETLPPPGPTTSEARTWPPADPELR